MIVARHIDLQTQLACNRWAILDDAAASRPFRRDKRANRIGVSWGQWLRTRHMLNCIARTDGRWLLDEPEFKRVGE
jgi:hypothetical protein